MSSKGALGKKDRSGTLSKKWTKGKLAAGLDADASTGFSPSELQVTVLKVFRAHGYNIGIGDACREVG